jgi:2Fe-2S ferredoxin
MPQIVIQNMDKKIVEVQDFSKTVLQHVQQQGIDWMHACGGKGRCTTCIFTILAGADKLEPKTAAEEKYENLGALLTNERLACQARINGDITIAVPEASQLPHIPYT